MDSKPFWQSKTLWANVVMLIADVANGAYGAVPIPPEYKVYVVLAVNILLRIATSKGLAVSAVKK
jgi:hypothetical protein